MATTKTTPKAPPPIPPKPVVTIPKDPPKPVVTAPKNPLEVMADEYSAANEALTTAWKRYYEAHVFLAEKLVITPAEVATEVRRTVSKRGTDHEKIIAEITCQAKSMRRLY